MAAASSVAASAPASASITAGRHIHARQGVQAQGVPVGQQVLHDARCHDGAGQTPDILRIPQQFLRGRARTDRRGVKTGLQVVEISCQPGKRCIVPAACEARSCSSAAQAA